MDGAMLVDARDGVRAGTPAARLEGQRGTIERWRGMEATARLHRSGWRWNWRDPGC